MCGIAGKIDHRGAVDRELLQRMCQQLEHRGPDSRGIHAAEGIGLGVQRLAVIDLRTGDQPIFNEDGSVVVVHNGEIYNYLELREQLQRRGHRFRTESDTEVIVHLYEEHGAHCVNALRGMFAFALWDESRRTILLARDRAGKKPLFYRATPTALWFASEPRAIFQDPAVGCSPDFDAIDSYLRVQYVPHPQSAFTGLHKLPPAHVLLWNGGDPQVSRYWQLDYRDGETCSIEEAAELVRESLLEATRLRLRADVPLGALLSGGIDSSAVVAAMARAGADRIKTFSIGFDVGSYDETAYAREVAERYGTDHHEFCVRPEAIDVLPRIVWHYGEPFADSSVLPTFYLAELARDHVTVALSGDGGDESFAGYERYFAQVETSRLDALPRPLRRLIAAAARRLGPGGRPRTLRSRAVRVFSEAATPAAQRYDRWMSIFTRDELDELYQPDFANRLSAGPATDSIAGTWNRSAARDLVDVMLDVDVRTYLPGDLLVKVDIATMAHSLEVRSPFLDHVLMERAARLPSALKLRGRETKALLRTAMRPWLPEAVIRRGKMGFGVPLFWWFRHGLAHLPAAVLLDPRALDRGIFRPSAIRGLIDDHRAARRDNSAKLWSLLALELWFQTYIDAAGTRPVSLSSGG